MIWCSSWYDCFDVAVCQFYHYWAFLLCHSCYLSFIFVVVLVILGLELELTIDPLLSTPTPTRFQKSSSRFIARRRNGSRGGVFSWFRAVLFIGCLTLVAGLRCSHDPSVGQRIGQAKVPGPPSLAGAGCLDDPDFDLGCEVEGEGDIYETYSHGLSPPVELGDDDDAWMMPPLIGDDDVIVHEESASLANDGDRDASRRPFSGFIPGKFVGRMPGAVYSTRGGKTGYYPDDSILALPRWARPRKTSLLHL